jgi:hypothetical protein
VIDARGNVGMKELTMAKDTMAKKKWQRVRRHEQGDGDGND